MRLRLVTRCGCAESDVIDESTVILDINDEADDVDDCVSAFCFF